MALNHSVPVPATRAPEGVDSVHWPPGAYQFTEGLTAIQFMCPCGCGNPGTLMVTPCDNQPVWGFNGNVERPTLTPSIRRSRACTYHGHLTEGVWTFEADSGR